MIQMQENVGGTPDEPRQPAHSEATEPQQDTSAAQPTEAAPLSADVPPSETPATPAHEEADAASGQPQEDSDDAPDADEPGDDVVPEELEAEAQDQPNEPDQVNQEG